MEAIKVVKLGQAEVQEVAIPSIYPDYVLVKVEAIALNPATGNPLTLHRRLVSRVLVQSPPS